MLEDLVEDADFIKRQLTRDKVQFVSEQVDTKDEFENAIKVFKPDVILSDHSLPQFDSLSALRIVKEKHPHIPFILVTGSVSEEFAVKCIKNGAEDYVLKSNLVRLPSVIESAINKKKLKTENNIIKNLNEQLKNANEIIEQKNRDTTDSITYARRIQRAILPDNKLLYSHFPESFILYKPKDIISGDFYWFEEHNGKFIIAVCDCTGHGVPGSLLSMIGHNLLGNIVHQKNITDPARILNEMNNGFRELFEIGKHSDIINDGMDIAICSIDKTDSSLTFSSARRPLYIIKDKILTELKGSSLPIGGGYREREPYKNKKIKIEKCSRYYMFTDGFADQFGGSNGKKLKTVGFKDLLISLSEEKMSATKEIVNNYFEEWRHNEEQTDDILIIGIEIN